jgi:serine/threonine-protein kinase RIO1
MVILFLDLCSPSTSLVVPPRYVSGDHRFQHGYCKSNPRKMVKMWAEKEFRNLMRLKDSGLNAPTPLQLRMHVLVMDFIGEDGVAAPRLKVRFCVVPCGIICCREI